MEIYGINFCECGCHKILPESKHARKNRRYIHGHNNKGVYFSKEHKEKIGISNIGKIRTEEQRKHISVGHLGQKAWNEGLIGFMAGRIVSEETRKRQSKSLKGKIRTEEQRKQMSESQRKRLENPEERAKCSHVVTKEQKRKNSESHLGLFVGEKHPLYGKHHTKESKQKMSETRIKRMENPEERQKISGENSPNWKGGITSEYKMIRSLYEYKQWRKEVFKRDNYTCHKCRIKGGKLHAHHIVNFSDIINDKDKLWNTDNGLTFCKKHHKEFHSIFGKKNNIPQQLFEFIYLQE